MDTNLPSNSPQINTCLGLGTHLNLDMGNGDDDSKRRRLILLLHIRLLAYESALFKRDIAILSKEAYPDTHFKVRHIVKECASQLGLKGKPPPPQIPKMVILTFQYIQGTPQELRKATLKRASECHEEVEAEIASCKARLLKEIRGSSFEEDDESESTTTPPTTPAMSLQTSRWIVMGLATVGIGLLALGIYTHFSKKK